MADELQFIEDGLQRSQIDEFFAEELARAGYGGMELAKTPMGTQIVLKAEKPGMVIGKGGKNIRAITAELERRFDLDDPQIDVQEVDEPDLNAQIVADRLANALERGWYFRKAGHVTLERIMDAGALGAEIVLSGKVTGNRGRVEKFTDGYVKHNGEPADTIVDRGKGISVMKLGTIGVNVMIIPPDADLPDDFRIVEDADVGEAAGGDGSSVEELIEGPDEETPAPTADETAEADAAEAEAAAVASAVEEEEATEEEVVEEEVTEEEVVEEEATEEEVVEAIEAEDVDAETGASPTSPPDVDEEDAGGEPLDEEIEAEAAALVEAMEAADEEGG